MVFQQTDTAQSDGASIIGLNNVITHQHSVCPLSLDLFVLATVRKANKLRIKYYIVALLCIPLLEIAIASWLPLLTA